MGYRVIKKEELLASIREALDTDVIKESDLKNFISSQAVDGSIPQSNKHKSSAADIMFYIGGIVLYLAILSVIVQNWEQGSVFVQIMMSAGLGSVLWIVAYRIIIGASRNDIRKGLINALLLTGSLSLVTGGYIISNEFMGEFDRVDFIPGALTLAIMAVVHAGFDRLIKSNFVLLMGAFLGVASIPALIFGFLEGSNATSDLWLLTLVFTAGLLAASTRFIVKHSPDRQKIRRSFDSFAGFLALISMYIASFISDYSTLWLVTLAISVYGAFYLSIVSQSRYLLGNASVFLVLIVVRIAYQYFSGFGITVVLVLSTMGLFGSAALASNINKKYFKQTN